MKNTIHGAGLGLRSQHFGEIIEKKPPHQYRDIAYDFHIAGSDHAAVATAAGPEQSHDRADEKGDQRGPET